MKLIELSGKSDTDLKNIDIRDLSNVDAAVWFLSMVVKANPHITWGELLGGNFTMSGNWLGDMGNWIADKSGDVINLSADLMGSAIRLLTDEEVQEGIGNYAEAGASAYAGYQSGGVTSMLESMFSGGGGTPQQQKIAMSAMGQNVKNAFGGIDPMVLYIGGGALFFMVMIMAMK